MNSSGIDKALFVLLAGLAVSLPVSIALSSIFFFSLLGVWVLAGPWTWRRDPPTWGLLEKALFVFLMCSLLSGVFSEYRARSFKNTLDDVYAFTAVLVIVWVRTPERASRITRLFVGAGVATAAWGIIQWLIGIDKTDNNVGEFLHLPGVFLHWPAFILEELRLINGRVTGTRSHPLTYAEGLLSVLGFVLSFWVASPKRAGWRWLFAGWALAGALLGSQSRGPWLAAVAMAGTLFLFRADRQTFLRLILWAVPCLLLSSAPALRNRAISILDKENHSNAERLVMWRAGWAMWKERPAFGFGVGNIKKISPRFQARPESSLDPWGHLHSVYFNFLAERGIAGLLAFLAVCAAMAFELRSRLRRTAVSSPDWPLLSGAVLALVGFLVSGLTETVYNDTEVVMMFFFAVGLGLAVARRAHAEHV